MITLMLHILLGLASLGFGTLALLKVNYKLLKLQVGALMGTVATGVALVVINPSSLMHLCVSGTVFSAVSVGLMVMARRQIAFASQTN